MYVAACVLALGFAACDSDDDTVDCTEAKTAYVDAAINYAEDGSIEKCNAYKTAIEVFLNNGCTEDEAEIKTLEGELNRLGDCTIATRVCLKCTNNGIILEVCRGENGNAFIVEKEEDRDTGIAFDKYIELSNCDVGN